MNIHLDYFVYPGHPITSAYLILQLYKKLSLARASTKKGWCEAESNDKIPGAGGVATAAVESLIKYKGHKNANLLIADLHYYWIKLTGPTTGNHENSFLEGITKAEQLSSDFRYLAYKAEREGFFDD
jgi:hypothetical protein